MLQSVTERWVKRLVVAALLVAGCVTVAHGQRAGEVFDRQRVLLVPMQAQEGVSPVVPTKVFEYMRTLVELNGDVTVFVPQTLKEPLREEMAQVAETDPMLTRADKFLWRAKERAAAGNYLQATNSFKQAVIHYQKGMDNLENFDKLVEARVGIALAFYYAGDAREGKKALRQVVEVRPDILLDKRKVPQEALDALESIKSRIAGVPSRPVKVVTDPPGAQVFVDGRLQGSAPIVVKGLTIGRHVLRVVKDGHKPRSRAFTTDGGKKKILKLRLTADNDGQSGGDTVAKLTPDLLERLLSDAVLKGDFSRRSFRKLLEQLQSRYDLDAIVMTYVRGNGEDYEVATFLYECVGKRIAELEWFSLDRELTNMQARLLGLEERVHAALAAFPASRELTKTSEIYVNVNAIRARQEAARRKREEAKRKRGEKKAKAAEAKRKRAEAKRKWADAKRKRADAKRRAKKEAKAKHVAMKRARAQARRRAQEEAKEEQLAMKRAREEAMRRAQEKKKQARQAKKRRLTESRRARTKAERRKRDAARARRADGERAEEAAAQRARDERAWKVRERRSRQEAARREREEADRYARQQQQAREDAARRQRDANHYDREEALRVRAAAAAREEAARRARELELELEAEEAEEWRERDPEVQPYETEYGDDDVVGLADPDAWNVDDGEDLSLGAYDVAEPTRSDSNPYDSIALDENAELAITVRRQGAGTPTPWYRKWWVWTAAGVVVAGATAGAVMALSQGSEDPGFKATVTW